MKTLILATLLTSLLLIGCQGMTLNTSQVANLVQYCNRAKLDYVIIYNNKGKATDVTCYKPGSPPPTNTPVGVLQ